ncbi:hypothetical protein JEQ12_017518 [Ovis aries]|uniref:Uncharacterized protein n=1 Tax=Ovis aries TaxID=9940 RepID=A0A836D0V5_SHEEP|nr:hypothetical protein JEQ12_017518 [Ovis aries]
MSVEGSAPENILSGKPTPPRPVRSLHQRAFGAAASPYPARHLIPNQPRPHLCPRSPPSARRAPVTSLPTRPPIPHLRGKARFLSRTHQQRRQPARTMSLSASHLRHRGSRTERLPRAAARDGNVPFRPPHRPPFPAPVHTSNQQRRRVRRAEVSGRVAEDRLQRALRRATRNTDVPPPLPPPPLIVLPLPKGLGNPPARLQPIKHLLRELDPTFSRPSAEHAQNAAALTYSRSRKAGEPEPA